MPGRDPMPAWVDPELATLTRDRFSDPAWIYERKLDGERCLAFRDGSGLRLMTRNQKPVSTTYPEVAGALAAQDATEFIIDGEVVAFADGQTRFAQLQQRMQVAQPPAELLRAVPVQYYVFDVMYADGNGPAEPAATGAQGAAARPAGVRRAAVLHRAPDPGRRGLLRAGVPGRLGGADRQAGGRPVPVRADPRLAEVQVREQPGVRHRRVHRPAGLTDTGWARCCSATTTATGSSPTRARSAPGSTPARCTGCTRIWDRWSGTGPRSRRASCHAAAGCTGPSRGWSRRSGSASGPPRAQLRHPRFQGLRRDKSPAEVIREVPQGDG